MWDFLKEPWFRWVLCSAIIVASIPISILLEHLFFIFVLGLARRTRTEVDDILVKTGRHHFFLWLFLGFVYFATLIPYIPPGARGVFIQTLIVIFLASMSIFLASFITKLVRYYATKKGLSIGLTSVTEAIIKIVIIIIGVILILTNIGVDLIAIIATIGIGSLGIALALQDTLANLFAGFYIVSTKQISPGDYIKTESGHEGIVIDIDWRSTHVKDIFDNTITIPNAVLAKTTVINYHQPDRELIIPIDVGISYNADLNIVEQVTKEVAKEVLTQVEGGVADFQPYVEYQKFGDSSITLRVYLKIKKYLDKFNITHEFIKRLRKRYAQHGIEIPFPQRVIHIHQK